MRRGETKSAGVLLHRALKNGNFTNNIHEKYILPAQIIVLFRILELTMCASKSNIVSKSAYSITRRFEQVTYSCVSKAPPR